MRLFLTATYLVNRLPSAALGGAIPLQRLTPAADLFSLPPRVFRLHCLCCPGSHPWPSPRLAPRAQKGCVLSGYSRTQKGYRVVLFQIDDSTFTSADVTFHEGRSPTLPLLRLVTTSPPHPSFLRYPLPLSLTSLCPVFHSLA